MPKKDAKPAKKPAAKKSAAKSAALACHCGAKPIRVHRCSCGERFGLCSDDHAAETQKALAEHRASCKG